MTNDYTQNNGNLTPKIRRIKTILLIVSFLVVFAIGLVIGFYVNIRQSLLDHNGSVDITKVLNLYSKSRSTEVSFDQFWDVWNKVKNEHVGDPVDEVKLYYGAIKGMVDGLNDPYSVYFPPQQAEEFANDLAGEFSGIGAEIGKKNEKLLVIAPLPSSPAERAGLKAGDTIYAIDNQDASNLSVEEAVNKIRGPSGTKVKLTISNDGFEAIKEVEIVRESINIPTVRWEKKDNNLVYLRLSYFNQNTWDEFDKAVKEIVAIQPKGIIFDMRNNPGGFLETSIDVASEWVKNGIIVSEGPDLENKKDVFTRGKHRLADIPTIVLVDEGTASGSEIVAGAIQDHQIGQVVGAQTYGKGSVQDFEAFPDGSALKLTIAKWFTPNGREINKIGITPDIKLDKMFEEIKNEKGESTLKDLGLEKALELFKK